MKIAMLCDTVNDYQCDENFYYDFSFKEEIIYVKSKLESLGHTIIVIHDPKEFVKNIENYRKEIDIVFNMFEGFKSRNREGVVPCICELFDIPYTGSDAFGMSLTQNKHFLKAYASTLNIKSPKGIRIFPEDDILKLVEDWTIFPCIVKPEHEGSSMGLFLISNSEQLIASIIDLTTTYKQAVLVEEYIDGSELSVCIVENNGVPEILNVKQFTTTDGKNIPIFDREIKKFKNHESIKPTISREILLEISQQSLILFKRIPLNDVARFDWRINKASEPYLLEVTPLPDWRCEAEFETDSFGIELALSLILKNASRRYWL